MTDKPDDARNFEKQALFLIGERRKNRIRLFELVARDIQFEKGISGIVSVAEAYGHKLVLPHDPRPSPDCVRVFMTGRNQINIVADDWLKAWEAEDKGAGSGFSDDEQPPLLSPPMPKVADIALERLKAAGNEGSKAAQIREYIERTYHTEIHEKTVGMTLFRLRKAGKVRRDGHIWFLASPEAKNPGAGNAGAD